MPPREIPKRKAKKLFWWARVMNIRYMGPYDTQIEAWAATMGHDGTPVRDACVWYGPKPRDLVVAAHPRYGQ